MRAYRLFCPQLAAGTLTLSADESHHAATVLRAQPGDPVTLFDGRGREAPALIERVRPREVVVRAEAVTYRPFELSRQLTLAVALPRQHRQGYLIEKCTELGVAGIWPILTARGTARPRPDAVQKWSRRALEAAKQAQRAWVPVVAEPQSFEATLARIGEFDAAVLMHPDSTATRLSRWLADRAEACRLLVWVGPEGGWSEGEQAAAVEAQVPRARLTPTVLRTETAAVAVCAAVALLDTDTYPRSTPGTDPVD